MKIGRNDLCPCGSGKKYKKCCLYKSDQKKGSKDTPYQSEEQSMFPSIENEAKEICNALNKCSYRYSDVVAAVFCFNSWRKNRSALEQGLTLNLAVSMLNENGSRSIHSYDELQEFYNVIKPYIRITMKDDYTIDDFGEINVYFDGKHFPVITGTGHQSTYAAIRYMCNLSEVMGRQSELLSIFEYVKLIILMTQSANEPQDDDIKYITPSNEYWEAIKTLFGMQQFHILCDRVSGIMIRSNPLIDRMHFVKKEGVVFPLYNTSILLDYYHYLLQEAPAEAIKSHYKKCLYSLIENTYNSSGNPRVFLSPRAINRRTSVIEDVQSILFSYRTGNRVVIAYNNESIDREKEYEGRILRMQANCTLGIIEGLEREGKYKHYGFNVLPDDNVLFISVDMYSDVTIMHFRGTNGEFVCNILDIFNMLGFSDNLEEIADYIEYHNRETAQILSLGGQASLFFTWKMMQHSISQGAIEYGLINTQHDTVESYIYDYFKDKLSQFPFNGNRMFADPLNWSIKPGQLGFTEIVHKGLPGFGGNIKRIGEETYVFIAHNVTFFNKRDLETNSFELLKLIDEIIEKCIVRYSAAITQMTFIRGKTIEFLYQPWEYAKQYWNKEIDEIPEQYIISDEYTDDDVIVIRFTVRNELWSAIQNAKNRSVENNFFLELLRPLEKYSIVEYSDMMALISSDNYSLPTVGAMLITLEYYYSPWSRDMVVNDISFVQVRKEIAQICNSSGILPGEYHGDDATKMIREMQYKLTHAFENRISEYDQMQLHYDILGYYAVQQHGVSVHLQRYHAFGHLDTDARLAFERDTRNLRQQCRRNVETACYLIETNLSISRNSAGKKGSSQELMFLLAFADWLVVLQENADLCHYNDEDVFFTIDSEYRVNTEMEDQKQEQMDEWTARRYNSEEYHIKGDDIDKEYAERVQRAFIEDTGINLVELFDFLSFMCHDVTYSKRVTEIQPNVYRMSVDELVNEYQARFSEDAPSIQNIQAIIEFLTIDKERIKAIGETNYELIPIWEREKRANRFVVKPIVKTNGDVVFSPVAMHTIKSMWKNGIYDWFLPHETGLPTVKTVLDSWKKRYEDEMVRDLQHYLIEAGFDDCYTEVDLCKRFKKEGYPQNLGDYDLIAFHKYRKEMWIIESKVLHKVGSIFEDQMQQKGFFRQNKYDEKFQRRISFAQDNTSRIFQSFGYLNDGWTVVPYMVTNKVFDSRYKKIGFPIVSFSEFRSILDSICQL